jgi:hypothetical protein
VTKPICRARSGDVWEALQARGVGKMQEFLDTLAKLGANVRPQAHRADCEAPSGAWSGASSVTTRSGAILECDGKSAAASGEHLISKGPKRTYRCSPCLYLADSICFSCRADFS